MTELGEHGADKIGKKIGEIVHSFVKNPLPNEMYKSTSGVYGGEIRYDPQGKMVYDTRALRPQVLKGISSGIDVVGDRVLRPYDDHVVQNPIAMLKRHPKQFLGFVFRPNAPRHRGTTEQILENVKRLGLTEYYGKHPWGIEIKKPEIFIKGIALHDVLRAKEINSSVLTDIDPMQALREATICIKKMHDTHGPVGDLIGHIMFQKKEGKEVKDPVLSIPDIVLTPSKRKLKAIRASVIRNILSTTEEGEINKRVQSVVAREQKATDVLEYLFYTGFELLRQSKDAVYARKALDTIIQAYSDKDVLSITKSFIKRGRPTLPGMEKPKGVLKYLFPLHNKVHLSADLSNASQVRQLVIEELTSFLSDRRA